MEAAAVAHRRPACRSRPTRIRPRATASRSRRSSRRRGVAARARRHRPLRRHRGPRLPAGAHGRRARRSAWTGSAWSTCCRTTAASHRAARSSARLRRPHGPLARRRVLQPRDAAVVAGRARAATGTWRRSRAASCPMLRDGGVTDAELDQMLVDNPRRLLEPAPRAVGRVANGGRRDMRAALLVAPGRDRRRRRARARAGARRGPDRRRRRRACAARTSPSSAARGRRPRYPWIKGHEAFGRIEAVGERCPAEPASARSSWSSRTSPAAPARSAPRPDVGLRRPPVGRA